MHARIQIKRVYEEPSDEDGYRVLVDRLWPRGVKKELLPMDMWCKALAPSTELRKWFNHQPERQKAFAEKYLRELNELHTEALTLLDAAGDRPLTLLYAAKDERCNHALVLRDYLMSLVGASAKKNRPAGRAG